MKVLILYGSPHECGATRELLDKYLKTLEDADVTEISAYGVNASPCVDCGACAQSGRCAFSDMDGIYEAVEQSDLLIFASPVYNLSFPSPMKAIIDRFQVYFSRRFALNLRPPIEKPRQAAVLLTYQSDKYGGASHAVTALRMLCTVLNAKITYIETFKTK